MWAPGACHVGPVCGKEVPTSGLRAGFSCQSDSSARGGCVHDTSWSLPRIGPKQRPTDFFQALHPLHLGQNTAANNQLKGATQRAKMMLTVVLDDGSDPDQRTSSALGFPASTVPAMRSLLFVEFGGWKEDKGAKATAGTATGRGPSSPDAQARKAGGKPGQCVRNGLSVVRLSTHWRGSGKGSPPTGCPS